MPLLHVNNVLLFNNQLSKLAFFVKVAYLSAKKRWINGMVSRFLGDSCTDSFESR